MPYKDPERKKEWERLHRPERLDRRRELRRIEAAQQETPCKAPTVEVGASASLIPLIAALAAYSPKLGLALGGLTLASSAIFKKGWAWWLAGGSFSWRLCFSIGKIDRIQKLIPWVGRIVRPKAFLTSHQLAFDNGKRSPWGAGK